MATDRQIEANRRNAQKSTGPRTEEGREAVRGNSIRHGLAPTTIMHAPLRHEDPAVFHEMRAEMIQSWQPDGIKELQLVEMAASAYVRMQRCDSTEAAYMDGAMATIQRRHRVPAEPTANDPMGCGIALGDEDNKLTWQLLDRYRRNAWLDYDRAIRRLEAMQKARKEEALREREEQFRELRREEELAKRRAAATALPIHLLTKETTCDEWALLRQQNPGLLIVPDGHGLRHDRKGNMTSEIVKIDPDEPKIAA